MAIQEFQYDNTTLDDLENCVKWFQNKLNLRDWLVKISNEISPDQDIGSCIVQEDYLTAEITIDLNKCALMDKNPIQVIVHEMLHVMTLGVVRMEVTPSELISYRLEYILARVYYMEISKKLPKVRE